MRAINAMQEVKLGVGQKVMILDDDLLDVIAHRDALCDCGYEVTVLTSSNGVLAKIDYERPDVLLVNPWMARLNESELMQTLARQSRKDPHQLAHRPLLTPLLLPPKAFALPGSP